MSPRPRSWWKAQKDHLNLAELEQLVATGESETLEFKRSTAELRRAGEALCAFLNGEGGQVVIGVAPEGKVVGQQVSDNTLADREFEATPWPASQSGHRQRRPTRGSSVGASLPCWPAYPDPLHEVDRPVGYDLSSGSLRGGQHGAGEGR